MREAQKRGAKLVVIDPRTTALARAADVHLPVKPGHRRRRRSGDPSVSVRERLRRCARSFANTRTEPIACASARRSGPSSARRTTAGVDRVRARAGGEAVRGELAGAHPVRLGPRAQPQRRQRGDGGAGAARRRRKVRRARRRLFDEQFRVVEHHPAVDRQRRAGHARGEHESSRARADRVRRSARQRAVRLQLQSGGDGARSAARSSAASSARICSRSSSSR